MRCASGRSQARRQRRKISGLCAGAKVGHSPLSYGANARGRPTLRCGRASSRSGSVREAKSANRFARSAASRSKASPKASKFTRSPGGRLKSGRPAERQPRGDGLNALPFIGHARRGHCCWQVATVCEQPLLAHSAYVRNPVHTGCSQDQPRRGAQGRLDTFAACLGNGRSRYNPGIGPPMRNENAVRSLRAGRPISNDPVGRRKENILDLQATALQSAPVAGQIPHRSGKGFDQASPGNSDAVSETPLRAIDADVTAILASEETDVLQRRPGSESGIIALVSPSGFLWLLHFQSNRSNRLVSLTHLRLRSRSRRPRFRDQ